MISIFPLCTFHHLYEAALQSHLHMEFIMIFVSATEYRETDDHVYLS